MCVSYSWGDKAALPKQIPSGRPGNRDGSVSAKKFEASGVWGLGFTVWGGLGFRVWVGVWGLGFRVRVEFRVWGLGWGLPNLTSGSM